MKTSNNPVSSVLPAVRIPKKELRVRLGKLDWQASTDFFPFLTSREAPEWLSLDEDPRAVCIKSNPMRQVYRWRNDKQDLFVKIYRTGTFSRFFRYFFLNWPSRTEFRNLQIANSLDVPAPRPLAWAKKGFGRNALAILLTRSLGETTSLDSLLWSEPVLAGEALRQALRLSAELVARLYRAGICHPDFHPGNIILRPGCGANEFYTAAYITDLQDIQLRQRPSQTEADPRTGWRMKNLAMLAAGLRQRITTDEFLVFLGTYLRTIQPKGHFSAETIHAFMQDIDVLADRYRLAVLNRRDRRSLRDSRYSRTIPLGGGWLGRVYCQSKRPIPFSEFSRREYTPELWKEVLKHPKDLLQNAALIKKGTWNTVSSGPLRLGNEMVEVVLKHSEVPRTWKGFFKGFCRSRGMRNWHRANMLVARNIPTAWPLAAMEHSRWIFSHDESILITEKIQNSQSLYQMVKKGGLPASGKRRNALADKIGNLLGNLYLYRIRHRDCKASNLMVQQGEGGSPDRVFLIDLDGLQKQLPYIQFSSHRALIRLGISLGTQPSISPRDRIRTFRAYFRTVIQSESYKKKDKRLVKKELWKHLESRIARGMSGKKLPVNRK